MYLDDPSVINPIKNQILSLVVDITRNTSEFLLDCRKIIYSIVVFGNMLNIFPNLQCLNFNLSSVPRQCFSFEFGMYFPFITSSNLLELSICVEHFNDLLYILDGRFNQLRTLRVDVIFSKLCHKRITNRVDSL